MGKQSRKPFFQMNNSWLSFFRQHRHLVLFGLQLTFFSSFGQTFLLSLYVPEILQEFSITNAGFGGVYALATLLSAFSLTWAGRFIDTIDLKKFSWIVVAGMVFSLLLFSQAYHLVWLVIGLWGMRLSGQGLMSHTAITTMARYFEKDRGKAISIASLGHPAGSALLPLLMVLIIDQVGWRYSLLASALFVALVLPPLIAYLLKGQKTAPPSATKKEQKAEESGKATNPSYKKILSSRTFWLVAPGTIAVPFLNTSFFFYQIALAEAKGWSTEWAAASFIGYSVASALFMILAGQLIDRYSAAKVFPFFLFPLAAALVLVVTFDNAWIAPVYLILIGVSSGLGNPVKSAVQAELFGVEYIGTIRSLFTALMVVSTALGPAIFGLMLDAGLSFEQAFGIATVYLLLTIAWNFQMLFRKKATT